MKIESRAESREQCGESILENEDTPWTEEISNKNKTTLRSLTAEEINEIMSLHDELKSSYDSGLNQLKSSFEFEQLCLVINAKFELFELSNLSRTTKFWIQFSSYVKILRVYQRNTCRSVVCSCRKNGIKCVQAYGDWRGLSYNNANIQPYSR